MDFNGVQDVSKNKNQNLWVKIQTRVGHEEKCGRKEVIK